MKRATLQIILLIFLVVMCIVGYFISIHILGLPFRETNDALHKKGSSFNMDFLIPSSTHIDNTMTIGEVLKIRTEKQTSFYDRVVRTLSELIPFKYRYLANIFLFLFWSFLFMTFFRIFTFISYELALLGSLFIGSGVYLFMPDFIPFLYDDIILIALILLLILLRSYIFRKRKKKNKNRK